MPDWELTDVEASAAIDGLKARRGKPVWFGNGQFSHWEKAAREISLNKPQVQSLAEELASKIVRWLKRQPEDEVIGNATDVASGLIYVGDADGRSSHAVNVTVGFRPSSAKGAAVLAGRSLPGSITVYVNGALTPKDWLVPTPMINRLEPMPACTHETCLVYGLYSLLIHELTHNADIFATKLQYNPQEVLDKGEAAWGPYVNDPAEVRAFMQQVVDETERMARKIRTHVPSNQRLVDMVLRLSTTWSIIEKHLNSRNKARILKAVYDMLEREDLLIENPKTASLEKRVARRFQAVLLTKSWLMGVRRGWLSLLKPTINDWPDVFRAFDGLIEFVDNLKDQVVYVRKAPLLFLPDNDNKAKLQEAFKNLQDRLRDQRGSARYWYEAATGQLVVGQDDQLKAQGERMWDLYKRDFDASLETHVRTRGHGTPTRLGHMTDLLDDVLELLRKQAAEIEQSRQIVPEDTEQTWGTEEFKEFSIGNMKVVVVDPKFHGKLIGRYVSYIIKAKRILEQKGFGDVWYGQLIIASDSPKKLSEASQANYAALGYEIESAAGFYDPRGDRIELLHEPSETLVSVIVHELGHRYWFRFMSGGQRARFESLVKVRPGKPTPKKWVSPPPTKIPNEATLHEWWSKVDDAIGVFSSELDTFEKSRLWIQDAIDKFDRSLNTAMRDLRERFYDLRSQANLYDCKFDPNLDELGAILQGKSDPINAKVGDIYKLSSAVSFVSEEDALKYVPRGKDPQDRYKYVWRKVRADWLASVRPLLKPLADAFKDYFKRGYEAYLQWAQQRIKEYEEAKPESYKLDADNFLVDDPRMILPVSQYGRSHIDEAFAEVFMYYVLERDMNRDQLESFKSVLKTASLEERVASRYLIAAGYFK